MPRPLRSDSGDPVPDIQFKDFGVLNAGSQSKSSVATAVVLNVLVLCFIVLLGAATKRTIEERRRLTVLTEPIVIKQPEPVPPPKPLMRPPLPKPLVEKVEPPKITLPEKAPDVPKPVVVKMTQPAPIVTPAAPRKVIAPPAPQVVSLAHPQAASVVNNSAHPTAVALGQAENPIAPSNRPATTAINLGQRGLAGMPASNSGGGPPASKVNLGSGSPGGQTLAGNGVRPVEGVKLGVKGGTGALTSTSHQIGQVNLGQNTPPPTAHAVAASLTVQSAPKVLYKPTPAYTPEAASMRLTGSVAIRIRVGADGSVTVLGIASPLGHGLDQSAETAIRGTRFAPALDSTGRPVDWEGVVRVNFQLAG